ncbi:hypothetical protein MF408_09425 [Nocardioides sp. TF02-7]|nr:hypothetical protein [Nocardioides sp. TF02-7]UMG94214.1 hypothetical protein MF408_09425 [Nocardioides sp. TF02-7]
MRPLVAVALGLVVVALYARSGSFDLLVDPLGWLLVLLGVRVLADRTGLRHRAWLGLLGWLALLVSAVLVVPDARAWLEDAEPALGWVADLPALAFCGLLCHALAGRAKAAGQTGAAAWAEWTAVGFAFTALAPALVIGGGLQGAARTGRGGHRPRPALAVRAVPRLLGTRLGRRPSDGRVGRVGPGSPGRCRPAGAARPVSPWPVGSGAT